MTCYRWLLTVFLIGVCVLSLQGPLSTLPYPNAFAASEGVPAFGHVFVIIGENTEISQLSASVAPYITGTIKSESAWLTGYYAVTHASEPNYVGMTSGTFTNCGDASPSAACDLNVNNLFEQLDATGVSWQTWAESTPFPCWLGNDGTPATLNPYIVHHNPAVYYDYLVTGGTTRTTECMQRVISTSAGTDSNVGPNDMSVFNTALGSGNASRFNYIVPNGCEDSHDDGCPTNGGNQITNFDSFLSREIPLIKSSSAYGSNGVIIITYDEGTTGNGNCNPNNCNFKTVGSFAGGNVMFAVISPLVNVGQYGGMYNHFGFLRTMEDGFGVSGYLGNATTASPINTIWKLDSTTTTTTSSSHSSSTTTTTSTTTSTTSLDSGIANDGTSANSCKSCTSTSFSFTHRANVLVVVVVGYGQNVPTAVSVGVSSASKLISIAASTGPSVAEDLWYVFLFSSGTGTVSVQTKTGANNYLNVIAQSFTGTVTTAPFFEKTATNTATGRSISVTVNSGTVGRRIIMAVAAPNSSSFTLGSGQENILSTQGNLRFADLNYEDSSTQMTMSLSNFGVTTNLVTIGAAILPSSARPSISLPPTTASIDEVILSTALSQNYSWLRGFSLYSDQFMALNSEISPFKIGLGYMSVPM